MPMVKNPDSKSDNTRAVPATKSFFKPDTSHTVEGAKLSLQLDEFLSKIYQEYYSSGYQLREIQQLVNNSVTTQEMKFCVKASDEIYTDARQKKLKRIQESVSYNLDTE